MVYKITGGIFFICLALGYFGIVSIPTWMLGLLALVAGGALLFSAL